MTSTQQGFLINDNTEADLKGAERLKNLWRCRLAINWLITLNSTLLKIHRQCFLILKHESIVLLEESKAKLCREASQKLKIVSFNMIQGDSWKSDLSHDKITSTMNNSNDSRVFFIETVEETFPKDSEKKIRKFFAVSVMLFAVLSDVVMQWMTSCFGDKRSSGH